MIKKRDSRKAQVSNEFIILLGILISISLVFSYFLAQDISSLSYKREMLLFEDLGYGIQNEFLMAQRVNDGYLRDFTVPETYYGFDYDITLQDELLILVSNRNDIEHSFLIPNVTGSINKGINIINKSGGVIYLN